MGIYSKYTKEINESVILEQINIIGEKPNSRFKILAFLFKTNAIIDGINVCIYSYEVNDNILNNLSTDIKVIKSKYKYIQSVKNDQFKNWLKISDEEFKTLKLYEIVYRAEHEFEFRYEYKDNIGNNYKVAIVVPINNGKVIDDDIDFIIPDDNEE
jgi:hypothetical protein